ncbi:hypothetical protein [Vibrio alginolyticus]|uniref:hypothetical protein n=1 Tax=Vibrio alginolyticus TaxID=663 RepID=UPI001303DE3F|nr:hypothetical protein [Vibrio alginolyticus]
MGQVRENLPNGDPRNKIEYLADCIDDAKQQAAGGAAPKYALWLDGKTHARVGHFGAYTGELVKRWTFDFYSEQRWMPFIYMRDEMGNVAEHRINLVNQALHFSLHNSRASAEYFYPNDYVNRLTSKKRPCYVDGQQVHAYEPIGWMFDGRKHSIELINEYPEGITDIGAGVFTGCIWNVRGYNEAGELVFYLPLDYGEGTEFYEEVSGMKYTQSCYKGDGWPEDSSKWVQLPPNVAAS